MILVLNCGSQSIKWKVFQKKDFKIVKEGYCLVKNSEKFEEILENELEKVANLPVVLIGHRVVHGKDFKEPVVLTQKNLEKLEKISSLAPLHNPFNILGIKVCQKLFKNVKQVAVFDTLFFKDLPEYACTYALPEKISREFGFRRYGFHGISHEYVAERAAEMLKKPFKKIKIITCHLGGGSSIAAIKKGKPVDISMGFTPMEGLVMMTRAGNLDSEIVLELAEKMGLEQSRQILNSESGIKGICKESEMLKVLEKIKKGDKKSNLALIMFIYSVQKYIGAYFAVLGGCDALVFTGTIGSGSAKIKNMICKNLNILNKTKILSIETDEELAIANKIKKI